MTNLSGVKIDLSCPGKGSPTGPKMRRGVPLDSLDDKLGASAFHWPFSKTHFMFLVNC
jgi:hypothetical protein